ncbi:MAG TPA: ABC transporter ATP-binding protein [Trueperaceae bacterium]
MSLLAREISLGYEKKQVLEEVTVELHPGEVVAVVGPNGAGKSTLLRALSGVERPWRGEVLLDGKALRRLSRHQVARKIAVAQQGGELPEAFRTIEIVAMGRSPHLRPLARESDADRAIIERSMRRTGVWELRERRVWELSGGERQRVVLARALAQEPTYLLLDEPTTHLDLRYQVEIVQHVRDQAKAGVGALVVLHDLNLAARGCDRLVMLARGKVVAHGPPAQVLDAELLRHVYGAAVELVGEGVPALIPKFEPGSHERDS